jgi:hypothetical protein
VLNGPVRCYPSLGVKLFLPLDHALRAAALKVRLHFGVEFSIEEVADLVAEREIFCC